ncbi:MAG TPA: PQQ-binding-like beta-propeller repeat protein [Chthoniobacteraceae bacterium]|nr:PQQ-binding-like beta-propeller repeat protein [Chthoniobacteraceae bacterium]
MPRGNIHQAIRNAVAAKGNSVSIVILIVKRLLVFPYPVLFALMLSVLSVQADDWPQWRGLNRDGVWREKGILEAIPASGLEVRWRAKVGQGYSGPVVAQGQVFVTDHQFNPEVERVVCFDEITGRQIWVHSYPTTYKDMEYGNGPRASPTVHDGMVYTFGTQGHLVCLNATNGEIVWKKSLREDLHGEIPRYGASAAPLVVGDLLTVCAGAQPDASVVALDRKTGELRWKALPDRPAYSAPIVIDFGGTQQLIVWTGDSITSFDPATGKVHWQVPWKASFDPAQMVATPVLHRDMLLFMGAWSRGSKMLKLDPAKPAATVLWETGAKPTTTISTPLFQDDDYFYAVLGNGSLGCLEAATGKEVWTTREPTSGSYGNLHMTPNSDRVFLFNHTGHLILARLTPKGYQELGRCLLVEPTAGYRAQGAIAWAHPAYANKHVFARNDRELVCASLAATQPVQTTSAPVVKAKVLSDFESNPALGLAFSPDGKMLAAATWQGLVKVIDLTTGKESPAPKPHNDWVCAVAFSPNGKLLVSAGGSEFKPERNKGKTTGQVKLWDAIASKELGEITGHTNKVFSAIFSPDSKTLATGSADQTVRLWDPTTREQRAVLDGHTDAVWCVAFSPDGKTIASASADRSVKLWDATTNQQSAELRGHEDEVRVVAFSPDGKTVATGSADWTVRLWDLATGKERAVLKAHGGAVQSLAFSADGHTLATGSTDDTVKLWDTASWRERVTLRGHRSGISALAFSPDGRTLASAGMDDAVRLWDLTESQ